MRWPYLIAAASLLVMQGASSADAKPKRAKLQDTKVRREYRRAWDGSYAAWPKGSIAAKKVKVDGVKLLLFDVDGNESWSDLGTDAWTVVDKQIGYAVPLERDIALNARRVTLTFAADGKSLEYVAHGKRPKGPDAEGILLLNRLRMSNGLPPVWIDAEMSAKCAEHAQYMDINGIGHYQDPRRKGYSKGGEEAGRRSGVCYDNPVNSVDRFWRTLFHRGGPCNPTARRAGIGSASKHTALWVERARRKWTYPVQIPAPGVEGVQTTFDARENPRPSPEIEQPGMPAQVLWPLGARPPTPASGELRVKSEKGRLVAAVFSSPDEPAHPTMPKNRFSLALLPKAPLVGGTKYWVRFHWKEKGRDHERTWTFTCAR